MIDTLKRMAIAALDPHHEGRTRELENLRAAAQQNGGYLQPNTWRRILGADGGLQGFDFYCCQQYQLRDINLWLRVHTCPQCKTRISIFEACGIKPGTPPEQWPDKFRALPVQQSTAPQKRSGPIDTWAAGVEEVGYEMTDPFNFSQGRK
jgi:hypothetical protein